MGLANGEIRLANVKVPFRHALRTDGELLGHCYPEQTTSDLVKSLDYPDLKLSPDPPDSGRSVRAARLGQVMQTVRDFGFVPNSLHPPWSRRENINGKRLVCRRF